MQQEYMRQVMCLKKIVLCRRIVGKPTYVCYIDFQKVYDMVPYEALFTKLKATSMTGTTLEFIKALYNRSRIQVRFKDGMSHLF